MLDRGVDVVVAEANLRFLGSAHFDDELTLEVSVIHLGNTSIVSEHQISRHGDELVQCTIRHVMVDRETLRKTEIPGWVRGGLSVWAAGAAAR